MTEKYLLGGYTKHNNNGIYEITYHINRRNFTDYSLVYEVEHPSYLILSNDKQLLFSIFANSEGGGLLVLERNEDGDGWQEVDSLITSSIPGCHLTYRESSQTIYISNYHLGQLDVLNLQNRQLIHQQTIQQPNVNILAQEKQSHLHFSGLNTIETLLFTCNLGTDTISTYEVDERGCLSLLHELNLPIGTGPRHLLLHPNEPYGYIIGELANNVTVISIDAQGHMAIAGSISNLSQQTDPQAKGAAIKISKDGRFLYTSTRFQNTITVFELHRQDHTIKRIQEISSGGQVPRDFTLNNRQDTLLVPHQDSNQISIFERDPDTGCLNLISTDTHVNECTCIQYAD